MGNKAVSIWMALLALVTFSGCGALGEKTSPKRVLELPGTGCLNELGTRVTEFVDGTVDPGQWSTVWGCTIDSMNLFRNYARGSVPEGYTAEDINGFVNTFLLTDKKASLSLVQRLYEFKASFIGGNTKVITPGELKLLADFVGVIRTETVSLIPHLRARKSDPTFANLSLFSDAITRTGINLLKGLPSETSTDFTGAAIDGLFAELKVLFKWDFPDNLSPVHLAVKTLLVGGQLDRISGKEWRPLLTAGFEFAGPVIAAMSLDPKVSKESPQYFEFLMTLLDKVRPTLERGIASGGGVIDYKVTDQLIKGLPKTWVDMNLEVLKNSVRIGVHKILGSNDGRGLDINALRTIYTLARDYVLSNSAITELFDVYQFDEIRGVDQKTLISAATDYGSRVGLTRKPLFDRIVDLAKRFRPLYHGKSEIVRIPETMYSKFNLERTNLVEMISNRLMVTYGSDKNGKRASSDDVKSLIDDFGDLLITIKLTDKINPDDHIKRTNESDWFTYAANGDKYMSVDEATNYIVYLLSTSALIEQYREATEKVCGIGRKDSLGWQWQDAACFRREFFGHMENFLDPFPRFKKYYMSLNAADRQIIYDGLEFSGRRYGITNRLIGCIDIQGIGGTLHFIETVFVRFDKDGSERLNVDETLSAVPVFGSVIAKELPGFLQNQNWAVEGAFTFTLKKGKKPVSAGDIAEMFLWISTRPFWSLDVPRAGVYKLMSVLVPPPRTPLPGDNDDLP